MSQKCNPKKRQSSVSGCPVQSNFQSFSDGGLVILESTPANKMNSSLFFYWNHSILCLYQWLSQVNQKYLAVVKDWNNSFANDPSQNNNKATTFPPIFYGPKKTWDHLCYQTLELHATLNGLHEIVTCNSKSCIAHRTRTRIEIEH